MQWVKASERLPAKGYNYFVKATSHLQGYNHNDTALWKDGKWVFRYDPGYSVIEWLEEAGEPVTEKKECEKWCGMNYCDDNGCMNRVRVPTPLKP
jgi:hypothetical protein